MFWETELLGLSSKKSTRKKFLIFRKIEPSCSNLKNIFIFQETETLKKFLMFLGNYIFLYFLKRKLFSYFVKWNLLAESNNIIGL